MPSRNYLQHGSRHRPLGTDPIPGGFVVDRCAHYDTLAIAHATVVAITWGPITGGDFEHGNTIFDYSLPHSPKVLETGWYSVAVWANLTTGQGSFAGEYAQLAVDFDTGAGGDNSDLVQAFPLQDSGYGTAAVSVTSFIPANHGFDASVRHQHASSLNFQSFVFTQRLA